MSDSGAMNISGRLRARTDGDSSRPPSERGSDVSLNATGRSENPLKKVLARRVSSLRRQYTERARQEAAAEKERNKAVLVAALANKVRASQHTKSLPIKRTAAIPQEGVAQAKAGGLRAVVVTNATLGKEGSQQIQAGVIPKGTTVPIYKSWSYLMRNEIALEVGRKMFYTDSTGETIPASDSEEEPQGDSTLEGIYREREHWVVTQIVAELGQSPEIIHLLANKINSTPGAIESVISGKLDTGVTSGAEGKSLGGMLIGTYLQMFCRRCRVYNCLTHESPQVRPWKKPAVLDESSKPRAACGPKCWRLSVPRLLLRGPDSPPAVTNVPVTASVPDVVGAAQRGRPPRVPPAAAAAEQLGSTRARPDSGADDVGHLKRSKSRFAEEAAAQAAGAERRVIQPYSGLLQQSVVASMQQSVVASMQQPGVTTRHPLEAAEEPICLSGSSTEPSKGARNDIIISVSSSSEDGNGKKSLSTATAPAVTSPHSQAVPAANLAREEMGVARDSETGDILKATSAQANERVIQGELLSRQASAASAASPSTAPVSVDYATLTAVPSRKRRLPEGEQTASVSPAEPGGWGTFEKQILERGQKLFGDDACKLARLIGSRTCAEVAEELGLSDRDEVAEADESDELGAAPLKPYVRGRGKNKPLSLRKRSSQATIASKRRQHKEALWDAYTPCNCQGHCGKDCVCLASKHFCEKFCACGPGCLQAFSGCVCSSGCRTKTCPCFAAGHECDPDICRGCTNVILRQPPPPGKESCCNMRLRLRQHKRIAVGLSTVAGWGAFLLEGAHKNELLGEYTGELIDQAEADRRGKVYDRDDNSYLFNLNKTWVIDARTRGNKLRFANHSMDPNCRAEILMVDGDHRVGIFASRDIAAGSELFYDYRYDREQAPAWARDDAAA